MDEVRHASLFVPGVAPERPPLVVLHGTGGRETDLMPFAEEIAPGAAQLGVRGTVEIAGGYAFFLRYPDRRVDEADLARRVPALAGSISTFLRENHMFRRPIAVGFSNGAIAAAAVLHMVPDLFAAAVLLRPLPPLTASPQKRLDDTPVLIIDALHDERRLPDDGQRAAEQLRLAGAQVTRRVVPTGHELTGEDAEVTRTWLKCIH